MLEIGTLWGGTYLYGSYMGFLSPLPPPGHLPTTVDQEQFNELLVKYICSFSPIIFLREDVFAWPEKQGGEKKERPWSAANGGRRKKISQEEQKRKIAYNFYFFYHISRYEENVLRKAVIDCSWWIKRVASFLVGFMFLGSNVFELGSAWKTPSQTGVEEYPWGGPVGNQFDPTHREVVKKTNMAEHQRHSWDDMALCAHIPPEPMHVICSDRLGNLSTNFRGTLTKPRLYLFW